MNGNKKHEIKNTFKKYWAMPSFRLGLFQKLIALAIIALGLTMTIFERELTILIISLIIGIPVFFTRKRVVTV